MEIRPIEIDIQKDGIQVCIKDKNGESQIIKAQKPRQMGDILYKMVEDDLIDVDYHDAIWTAIHKSIAMMTNSEIEVGVPYNVIMVPWNKDGIPKSGGPIPTIPEFLKKLFSAIGTGSVPDAKKVTKPIQSIVDNLFETYGDIKPAGKQNQPTTCLVCGEKIGTNDTCPNCQTFKKATGE